MDQELSIVYDLHANLHGPISRKDDYLQSCIEKLEFILENSENVLFLGDVFEKARSEDYVKNMLLSTFNKYPKVQIYTILGNHDVDKNNTETLNNTSLGNLIFHRNVHLLTSDKIWNIAGMSIGVLDYDIAKAKKQEFSNPVDIVVGHHAYEWKRDLSQGIEEEDIIRYGAQIAFFGHDHEPHPVKNVNGTRIFRCGSTMRTALRDYTSRHKPSFCKVSRGMVKIVEIPHKPYEEIFRVEEKKEFKRCAKLVSEIKDFLASTEMKSSGNKSIEEVLTKDLKAPKAEIDYLRLVYRCNCIPF